jgi:hypothetical protein
MMIGIYALFLYNLASSLFIMRLVEAKKPEDALKIKSKAIRFLPVIVILMAALITLLKKLPFLFMV